MANYDSFNITPIKTIEFPIKASALYNEKRQKSILLGIDFGCSLIKIVYVRKENNNNCKTDDPLIMTAALFANPNSQEDYVESVLKWVKLRADLTPIVCGQNNTLNNDKHVIITTGVKAAYYRNVVELVFGISCSTISEEASIIAGHSLGLKFIGVDVLARSDKKFDVEYRQCELTALKKFFECFNKKDSENTDATSVFPCVVLQGGSNGSLVYYDRDGNGTNLGTMIPCGKLMMGLSKSLIDINDYDTLMELAMKGERGNLDSQVKDNFTRTEPDSPYDVWPLEMPHFSFGKCMDIDAENNKVMTKEDLAASLVGMIYLDLFMNVCLVSNAFKTTKVFFTGNFFNSDVFLKTHARVTKYFYQYIDFNMLEFGYAGALACAMLHECDAEGYINNVW